MPPNPSTRTPVSNPEVNLIVALMEHIEGLRSDLRTQTESITRKLDVQDQKFDAQARETRGEFFELRNEISDVKARLAEGSERMRNHGKDIDSIKATCQSKHPSTTALQRKEDSDSSRRPAKKSPPWWLTLLVGGSLAFVGERAAKFFINGMADQPLATIPSVRHPQP